MSLSKKHPLRLLLPSDIAQDFPGESPQTAETDGLFSFISAPAPENDQHDTDPELQQIGNGAMNATVVCDSDLPEPLPYSAPGPGSRLDGHTVASKTSLSVSSLQTSSSPTLFNIESHLPLHKQYIDCPKAWTASHHHDGLQFDSDSSPLADNPYVSQIYAAPGPTYRAPVTLVETKAAPNQLTTSDTQLDFHWRPFDRKKLVAPVLSQAPAFAQRSTAKAYSDHSTTVKADRLILQTRDAGQLISPISPSPFLFSPLDVPPAESANDPESQDHPKGNKTPPLQLLPSAWVPAIYSAPQSLPPGRTPASLTLAETGTLSKVFRIVCVLACQFNSSSIVGQRFS
jgi:hypothetical protein